MTACERCKKRLTMKCPANNDKEPCEVVACCRCVHWAEDGCAMKIPSWANRCSEFFNRGAGEKGY